jgi:imidazolonepropionase-like amidohydrolase
MKQKGTYYVPTLTAGRFVGEQAKIPGYYHPLVVPKAAAIGPQIQKTYAKAYKKGVKIAFGTDAGVFFHGDNAQEFALLVEGGMPPMEAIKCATSVNASILNMLDQLGTIEPGKIADIIATDENPLQNIRTLEKVTFVMKEGVIYKQ